MLPCNRFGPMLYMPKISETNFSAKTLPILNSQHKAETRQKAIRRSLTTMFPQCCMKRSAATKTKSESFSTVMRNRHGKATDVSAVQGVDGA